MRVPGPARWGWAGVCGLACLACPAAIAWLGYAYGFDRLPSDAAFRAWPLYAVNGLFGLDCGATAGLLWLLPSRRWLGALAAVPLWLLTGVLAVTCGMWIDGSYF